MGNRVWVNNSETTMHVSGIEQLWKWMAVDGGYASHCDSGQLQVSKDVGRKEAKMIHMVINQS